VAHWLLCAAAWASQPPGAVPEMFRYVIPWLPENPHPDQEAAYYLIAALFAWHPASAGQGNMGDHMAAARGEGNEDALERRFTALLSAHPDDLPDYLRQAVSFLKSKEIAIHWNQLFYDLQYWSHPEYGDQIRKRWATTFWRRQAEQKTVAR
jgi:CRISPR system Cascade subunit CasB